LQEFDDINNVQKLATIFKEEGWNLVKDNTKNEELYQLFFGRNVQVDNMYEYGFSHLLDRKKTKLELERFLEHRISLENKYRFYVYDFLIGQEILTIDTQERKYRIDGFNIHGQCYSLKNDWKKISKSNILRAMKSNEYAIDKYFYTHFVNPKDDDHTKKELLYHSNNYDDCILFLVKYGKENLNCSNNKNFDYYKEYLEDKAKEIEENNEKEKEMEME